MPFYADLQEAFPTYDWAKMSSNDCHYNIQDPPLIQHQQDQNLTSHDSHQDTMSPSPYQNIEAFQPPLSSVINTEPWIKKINKENYIQEQRPHVNHINYGYFNDLDRLLFILVIGVGLLIAIDYITRYLRM